MIKKSDSSVKNCLFFVLLMKKSYGNTDSKTKLRKTLKIIIFVMFEGAKRHNFVSIFKGPAIIPTKKSDSWVKNWLFFVLPDHKKLSKYGF